MKRSSTRAVILLTALLFGSVGMAAQSSAEEKILTYIDSHLRPGHPLDVTILYNQVFTSPSERQALDKLYQAFFRIPLFIAQYQEKFRKPPTLEVISQQFALGSPQAADVLLRVMESDPRLPRFISRNPKTGEITHVDVQSIEGDPRFNQAGSHRLGGWVGQPAPPFELEVLGGSTLNSARLRGKVVLLYLWFTGCPPCMKEAPDLDTLRRDLAAKGFEVVGANADTVLHLGYNERVRARYVQEEKISFPVVEWTAASDQAFGNISIFPTLFLIDRTGKVIAHWVGYTIPREIRTAVIQALAEPAKR